MSPGASRVEAQVVAAAMASLTWSSPNVSVTSVSNVPLAIRRLTVRKTPSSRSDDCAASQIGALVVRDLAGRVKQLSAGTFNDCRLRARGRIVTLRLVSRSHRRDVTAAG